MKRMRTFIGTRNDGEQSEQPLGEPYPDRQVNDLHDEYRALDQGTDLHEEYQAPVRFGLLESMRWQWGLVLVPVVVLVAAAVVIGLVRSPAYTATARLNVGFGAQSPDSLPGSVSAAQALADSYSRAIDSTAVVRDAARRTSSTPQDVVDRIAATPIPTTTVIKVTGRGSSTRSATALANAGAGSLILYTNGLTGTGTGSRRVLTEFRNAEVDYQKRLDHQRALAGLAASNPTTANVIALKEARVSTQVARLQRDSLSQSYRGSQQAYVAPLSFLSRATSASSDRLPKLELMLFIGLVAGLTIGGALATVWANRV
jgi:capsular polysaccharide biosynthesis protein